MRVLGAQGLQPLHNAEATSMESAAQAKGLENMVALYHESAGKGESHCESEVTKGDRPVRFGEMTLSASELYGCGVASRLVGQPYRSALCFDLRTRAFFG